MTSLHCRIVGDDDGPPVLLLHGLFGSAANWVPMAKGLAAAGFQAVALDLPNHGRSPHQRDVSYPAMADAVADFMAIHGIDSACVVGHSMGGKVAMALALGNPGLVERLVVVDIAPTYSQASEARTFARVMQNTPLERFERREEVDAALAETVADPRQRGFLLHNLTRRGERFEWRLNLDALVAGFEAIAGFPDFAATFDGPTLFLAGGESDYVTAEDEPAIHALFQSARIETIASAGHWVHADAPDALLARLEAFLG